MLSRVLGDLLAQGVLVKIHDDLVIGGRTVDELQSNWMKVLQRLQQNNISCQLKKNCNLPYDCFYIGMDMVSRYSQSRSPQIKSIQATTDLKHPTGSLIHANDAPGFIALQTDNVLTNFGIQIDLGRIKNVNKNATADKAVQEIEKEIKRLVPDGGPITPNTLALVVSDVNSRIRFNGLSAREIVLKRDQYTGEPLSLP